MSGPTPRTSEGRFCALLFVTLFVSYAYFYQGGGWNENSRLDLTRALVEHGTFSIDAFHTNTGDKSFFRGHYYSDKAPGVSLLGVPAYAIFSMFRGSFASEHHFVVAAAYFVTVFTVAVASAALGVLVYRAARSLGAGPPASASAALGYGLGTIAFPLSTMLFSHQVAALLLFGAFYLARRCKLRPSAAASAGVGLCLAAAVAVEFPSIIAAPIIGLYHLDVSAARRRVLLFAAGLGVPALFLGIYLWTTFGSPLRVGYDVLSDPASRAEMQTRGLFGVTYPKVGVIVELLIGRFRGLLPYSPVLLAATAGFFRRGYRRERLTCLGVVVVYFLFVSSYEWWQGGASFGSRHLAPMLPFWSLGIAWAASERPKLTAAVAAFSVACMTVVTAVQPKPGEVYRDPLWGAMLPRFVAGKLPASNVCTFTGRPEGADHVPLVRASRHDSFNAGMVFGATGLRSLVPLGVFWLACGLLIRREARRIPAQQEGAEDEPRDDG